jgi:hypothetical protein
MPNHPHLLVHTDDPERERRHLASVLAAFTRRVGERRLWEPVPRPSLIADEKHLLRTMRYLHLNPCRDGLVADPLLWPWSTHRGIVGAEVDPWIDVRSLARMAALGRGVKDVARWFHAYVSSDPSCAPGGTPFPEPRLPDEWPTISLAQVISAAIAAMPLAGWYGKRRRLAVQLARRQGYANSVIARALAIAERTVRQLAAPIQPILLAPAALCLGDARLQSSPGPETALSHPGGSTRRARVR